jgi:hypothetical protein
MAMMPQMRPCATAPGMEFTKEVRKSIKTSSFRKAPKQRGKRVISPSSLL